MRLVPLVDVADLEYVKVLLWNVGSPVPPRAARDDDDTDHHDHDHDAADDHDVDDADVHDTEHLTCAASCRSVCSR